MDDLIAEFIAETQDSLDELDIDLIAFGENPGDKSLLDKIFRVMHTIKGTCGFLGLPRLEKIAHITENLLDIFRSDGRLAGQDDIAAIHMSLDQIRVLCAHIQSHNTEPEGDDSALLARLDAAISGTSLPEESSGQTPEELPEDPSEQAAGQAQEDTPDMPSPEDAAGAIGAPAAPSPVPSPCLPHKRLRNPRIRPKRMRICALTSTRWKNY